MDDNYPRSQGSLWNELAQGIVTIKDVQFEGLTQEETVTLTGTSGTATMAVAGGLTKTVTFDTDLTTTAANFVTSFAADYAAVGITITSALDVITFAASSAGVPFASPTITNATGDLAGNVAVVQANAAVTDSPGDFDGANNPYTVFTVTGDVIIDHVFPIVKSTLYGDAATIKYGVTESAGFWAGGTPDVAANLVTPDIYIGSGTYPAGITTLLDADQIPPYAATNTLIIQTAGTADITAGKLTYYCIWRPLHSGASVR